MTAQILIVFEIWRFLKIFLFFQKNLDIKKINRTWISNPILWCYRGTLKSCKSSVQVWLLKYLWFSRYGVFYDLFIFFQKLRYKKLTELEFLIPKVAWYRGTIEGSKSSVQVWLLKSLWFSRYGVFSDFSFFSQKT